MAERDLPIRPRRAAPTYAADYAAWLQNQVGLMKASRWTELDMENLIDEVESLGRSDFKGFVSAIEVVIAHMLKWDFQSDRRSPSWIGSIDEHRARIEQELADSPSYKSRIDEALARAYRPARGRASADTRLPLSAFPTDCPYVWADIMARDHLLAD